MAAFGFPVFSPCDAVILLNLHVAALQEESLSTSQD